MNSRNIRSPSGIVTVSLLTLACFAATAAGREPAAGNAVSKIQPPKHIVILLADTLRWDHVGAYGTTHSRTPNLDALAEEGVLFRNAFTVFPGSAPSYTSFLSAMLPFEHGLTNNAQPLPEDLPYLPESAREWGFHTAAFVSNYYCGKKFGFDRGYDTFHGVGEVGKHSWTLSRMLLPWLREWNPEERPLFLFVAYMDLHVPYSLPYNPRWLRVRLDGRVILEPVSTEMNPTRTIRMTVPPGRHRLVFERAVPPLRPWWNPKYRITPHGWSSVLKAGVRIEFTRNVEDRRVDHRADTVSWMSTAFPVTAALTNPTDKPITGDLSIEFSRRYEVEDTRTIYPRSVEFLDHEIGKVLDVLEGKGVLDETMVVLVSDHGEGLGDHGLKGHIEHLYDSLMRVPLILRYPPLGKGAVVEPMVSLVDFTPTVAELLDRTWPSAHGRSMVPAVLGGGGSGRDWAFAETYPPEASWRATCLRTPTAKLIVNHTTRAIEFYDLVSDPGESRNLYSETSEDAGRAVAEYCGIFNLDTPFDELSSVPGLDLDSLSPEEIRQLKALGYLE
jgi:arylsulfatase A-like enzyme